MLDKQATLNFINARIEELSQQNYPEVIHHLHELEILKGEIESSKLDTKVW